MLKVSKYLVQGTIPVTIEVEANSKNEALERGAMEIAKNIDKYADYLRVSSEEE